MRTIGILALALAAASPGFCGTVFNFSGTFTADDNLQFFQYTVQNNGPVNVFTTSFATGGFAPVLSIFDASGILQASNVGSQTNDCVNNATDPATGSCWDARVALLNSLAGTQYLIALTEDDNLPLGPTLLDGFFEQGNGNFTAAPPFNPIVPGGAFLLSGPIQRTADWAVTIQGADAAAAIPEPSTFGLLLAGAGCIAFYKRAQSKTRHE